MKPIESPTAFWKNMDKVFAPGHNEQSISLVPWSLLKYVVRWTGFGSLSGFYKLSLLVIATQLGCMAGWFVIRPP